VARRPKFHSLARDVRLSSWVLLDSMKNCGPWFTIKWLFDFLGINTYVKMRYPFCGYEVTVRASPVWKRIERGKQEPACLRYLTNLELQGKTVLDVGAAFGSYSLLLSKLVGTTGFVYAFDPDPKAVKVLRENTQMNGLSNVHVEERCLSNVSGKTKLRANVFGIGVSSIMNKPTEGAIQEIDVETTTIDKFCEENDIRPDGIKIDVEGAERKVVEGAQNTIRKYSPWILLEFHGNYMDEEERRETWALFSRTAKRIVFVDGSTRLYSYGSILDTMPEVKEFHVFAQY